MEFILSIFSKWGLVAVFIFILLEYACFPIPSEIVLPFSGFIASSSNYNIVGVILLSVIMGYIGCLICYLIGYYGGNYIYNKIYNKFPKWRKGLKSAEIKFNKYGNISVFVCRLIPLCRTYISFFAGIFKQSLLKYSFYSVLGILFWNIILISFGYFLGDNWTLVSGYYDRYKFIFIGMIALLLVLFFVYKKIKREKNNIGDFMPYFSYHGRNKRMIKEGLLEQYFYENKDNKTFLYLVFKDGRKMPIKEERWREYYKLIDEYYKKEVN